MKCPNCKEDLFENQLFCHKCGKPIPKQEAEDKAEKKNKGKEK